MVTLGYIIFGYLYLDELNQNQVRPHEVSVLTSLFSILLCVGVCVSILTSHLCLQGPAK